MLGYVEIGALRVDVLEAEIVFYQCAHPTGRWRIRLVFPEREVYVTGTVSPSPRVTADVMHAHLEMDMDSLSDLLSQIAAREVASLPSPHDAKSIEIHRDPMGLVLITDFALDSDGARARIQVRPHAHDFLRGELP